MCKFKSGIILKNSCVMSEDENESHADILQKLEICDDFENAHRVFVRAELVPKNNKWWTDQTTWEFIVDQDFLPDWYLEDPEKYESEFRTAVSDWMKGHIINDKHINCINDGYY